MELYFTARRSLVLLSYMFPGKIFIGAFVFLFLSFVASAQQRSIGIIAGQVLDSAGSKAVEGATVRLQFVSDTGRSTTIQTDRFGNFLLKEISFGVYRIEITASGFQSRRIDSIHIRDERADFNLGDILLGRKITDVAEVIIYAEKPMIESKDGNITFNVGESALSAGSNAAELLRNTPLVTTDPNGNVLVRGKEPRILIDEKPVELNAQQLQELLESMPGSNIEKIEVMTNPPAQFANEQGGVINIVTRKGKVGLSARLTVYGGTRNELGTSANLNYRKQGLAINFNAGIVNNVFEGDGYSYRTNIFRDSSNQLHINNQSRNENSRPNMRLNIDYDVNKHNALSVTANYNYNRFDNTGFNDFANINRFGQVWKRSERAVSTIGFNENFNTQVSYTKKSKKPGRTLRIIGTANTGTQDNERLFYQQFLNAVGIPNG
ncbi:MAG: TonB-dependent receptor, partial [Bacteroidetes bacterium]|nr:TonB-dependent receptor [Bacteroidota bacterium]